MRAVASEARQCLASRRDFAGSLARTTDHAGDNFSRVQQRLRRQVSVALCHLGRGMPKQSLDHVERHAAVYQEAGERVAQVVKAHVTETSTAPDAIPGIEHAAEAGRKYIRARRIASGWISATRWRRR